MAKAEAGAKEGSWNLFTFCRESWDEVKKVHRPTRQETVLMTVRVFMMVFIFGLFLGLTDLLVGKLMQTILT